MADPIRIALAGNPNCGKTTLYNALTGSNQFVGNWPGVTVEKKEGNLLHHDDVIITDLPGIYSLSPYTPEEIVARNYLVGERPDAILNLVDGTNLERNLYLTTQLTELGIPVVIAINMMDVVEKNGDRIDTDILSRKLGCRVVAISALRETGLMEAAEAAISAAKMGNPIPMHNFSGAVEHAIAHIEEAAVHSLPEEQQRWYAIKIFERDEKVLEQMSIEKEKLAHIERDIRAAEQELDDESDAIIINERYHHIDTVIKACYYRKNAGKLSVSDQIDNVMTHRFLALPIFALIMFLVYYLSMVTVGASASAWMNDGVFGAGWTFFGRWIPGIPTLVQNALESARVAPWLQGLINDGIVAGVGAVLGFLPQMFTLFFLLAFLESCGYMSRIAFVLDRVFRKFGLSGKSFIAMLIGTGCSVPGIMASRTIEKDADRRMTVITTSFIPCSAKVPFIGMIAGALFGNSAWVATSAYFVGMLAVVISGLMLKKTTPFIGADSPFVMELPAYHMPPLKNVLRSMWERGWSFVKKAGTVILLFSVLVWFLSNFGIVDGQFRMLTAKELDCSVLAAFGSAIAWLFAPLGWGNWQAVVAALTGIAAKENIVSTARILYGTSGNFEAAFRAAFTPISGYSFLLFNLLCAPCVAACAAIRREMNSAKWTLFAIGYQCVFAYCISLMVNQFGNLLLGHGNPAGILFALAVLVGMIWMLARPADRKEMKK